ncbi:MAG TPA: helix-turn-helix domain-containing protein, partial [Nocardioides sp.]|nr:helix-turn-helix domain-containing protein [Nocardioides sp.]
MRTIDVGDDSLSADQLTVRRTNLGLVLRRLRDHGPRSRATLATELGMTRSAVSTLVTELAERGLVRVVGGSAHDIET